jgi:hypothetical protein
MVTPRAAAQLFACNSVAQVKPSLRPWLDAGLKSQASIVFPHPQGAVATPGELAPIFGVAHSQVNRSTCGAQPVGEHIRREAFELSRCDAVFVAPGDGITTQANRHAHAPQSLNGISASTARAGAAVSSSRYVTFPARLCGARAIDAAFRRWSLVCDQTLGSYLLSIRITLTRLRFETQLLFCSTDRGSGAACSAWAGAFDPQDLANFTACQTELAGNPAGCQRSRNRSSTTAQTSGCSAQSIDSRSGVGSGSGAGAVYSVGRCSDASHHRAATPLLGTHADRPSHSTELALQETADAASHSTGSRSRAVGRAGVEQLQPAPGCLAAP